jgi:AraC-like DNA-binding protein
MNFSAISPYIRNVKVKELSGITPAYVDPDYVFTYIQSGSAVFLLEGNKYYVSSGDLIIMPPYITPHAKLNQYILHFDLFYSSARQGKIDLDSELTYPKFEGEDFYPENALCPFPRVVSLQGDERRIIEDAFGEIKNYFLREGFGFELKIKAVMLEILWVYFQRSCPEKQAAPTPKAWRNINNAISYIHENYMRPLDLREVSARAGLTLNYFCNIFKECTSTTPHHYINAVRVQKAKMLMEETDFNFTEISEMAGFSSIHIFSRIFKKLEGVSPSKYLSRLQD